MNRAEYYSNRFNINLQTNLICVLPFALVLSIFVADLIIVLLFFNFLIINFKNKLNYFNNFYFKYFFFYWLYITILSIFSENFLESIKSSFPYIRFILLPLIIFFLIKNDKKFLRKFFYSLVLLFIILIFDSFYEFIFGHNVLGYGNLEKGRLVSFFKDEYVLGTFITKFFFLIAYLWFSLSKKNQLNENLYFGFFYLLCFTIVFLSGDRMPFLLFILGTIIFLLISDLNKWFKISFSVLSIAVVVITLNLNQNLFDRIVKKTLFEIGSEKGLQNNGRLYKIKLENGKEITFLTQHQNYLITSYKVFKENPIFGKGNKGFKYNCHKYKLDCCSCASHPHNIYMQLLAENGIIGFLFFFFIFLWISYIFLTQLIRILWKDRIEILSNSKLCILICIYLNLWPIAQTGNLFNNWLSIIYFLPVGFLLNELNLKDNKFNANYNV